MPHVVSTDSPCWLSAAQLQPSPAEDVCEWLFNEDSLTRRLTALSVGAFSVTPLYEGWQVLREDECAALGVCESCQGWVREVFLRGHDQPWVFARSVATRAALQGSGLNLAELGSRSLGELLFSDRAFARGELQVCRYPADWLPPEVRQAGLWGRRSCFSRASLGVLVTEVFLPVFWQAADVTP